MHLHTEKLDIFEDLPLSLTGGHLNIQIDKVSGRVWICIDGHSVIRVKGIHTVSMDGETDLLAYQDSLREQE